MITIKIGLDNERSKEVLINHEPRIDRYDKFYYFRENSRESDDWTRREKLVYDYTNYNDEKIINVHGNRVHDRSLFNYDVSHSNRSFVVNNNSPQSFWQQRNHEDSIAKDLRPFVIKKKLKGIRGNRSGYQVRLRKDTAFARKRIAALSINSDVTTKVCDSALNVSPVQQSSNSIKLKEAILKYKAMQNTSDSSPNVIASQAEQRQSSATCVSTQTESPTMIDQSSSSSSSNIEKSILAIYRCSLCDSYMVPEFYECSSGHTSCEECWLTLSDCKMCNASYRRVHTLEKFARCLDFPCRWSQAGCQEILNAQQWREHVNECNYSNLMSVKQRSRSVASDDHCSTYYRNMPVLFENDDDCVELIDSDEE